MATSSSVSGGPLGGPLGGIVARAALLYVAAIGLAGLALALYIRDDHWALALAFLGAATATALITTAMLLPRLRHLRDVTEVAEALAAGRFEARAPVTGDELDRLAGALNTAGANLDRLVGGLRHEHAQLEALLNASSDATIAVDSDGVVVYLNDGARSTFATMGADAVGRAFIEVVRDHDLNDLLIAAARSRERSVRVVAYGQAQRWLQATAVPIEGAGAWAALALFHDLTEVRRLDSVRRDFISNVSHELRTPLAGIRAAAETLQEGALEDKEAAQEFLGHIQRETDRMTQMVQELLELSRIESGAAPLRFTQIDAAQLARDTVRRFGRQAERARISLTAAAPSEPVMFTGDEQRLEQALGNLVANALRFTAPGGSITIAAAAEGSDVAISVTDTGIGIEPEQQARVFERFYKADRGRGDEGTGLGLAIVKHIAQAHEGSVSVESHPGRGSTFTMRLPRR